LVEKYTHMRRLLVSPAVFSEQIFEPVEAGAWYGLWTPGLYDHVHLPYKIQWLDASGCVIGDAVSNAQAPDGAVRVRFYLP